MRYILALTACLFASNSSAATSGEELFLKDAAQLQLAPIQKTAAALADRALVEKYERMMGERFGWYGIAEQQKGLDGSQLAQKLVSDLKAGAYDVVEFGESHSNQDEQSAAKTVIDAILDAGLPLGAFLQEATQVSGPDGKPGKPYGIFPNTERMRQAGAKLELMKNQFNPDDDVKRGLKASGKKLLITYSGSAHTSARARDFIIETLKESDLSWGKIYPGRPVIEQSLNKRHRKPVVVAMQEESFVFPRVLGPAMKDAGSDVHLAQWRQNLAAVRDAWETIVASFQRSSAERFVPSPDQLNFFVGIAPIGHRDLQLEAQQKVAAMPELASWLGGTKIKSAQAIYFSGGRCSGEGYEVVVDKGGEEKFSRSVCAEELR